MVSIVSPALPVLAGDPLTVSCTATVVPFLVTTPFLHWRHADGSILSTSPPSAGGMEVREVVLELEFSPLRTSHGGQYSCVAGISIPDIAAAETSNMTESIKVQSESVSAHCSPEC